MKNTSKIVVIATIVALSLMLICSPAMAKAKYTLKFNHVLSPKDPFHAGFKKWAKAVKDRTKGEPRGPVRSQGASERLSGRTRSIPSPWPPGT